MGVVDGDGGFKWDYFVSYTAVDWAWANWVAWQLEEAGFRVLVQAWDMPVGTNWVRRIDDGIRQAARTVAILSPDYLDSVYGKAEWQAAWAVDPTGERRKLLVVRVADCDRPGLLGQIVTLDIFDRSETEARDQLVEAARLAASGGRAKPPALPALPNDSARREGSAVFPGRRWWPVDDHHTAGTHQADSTALFMAPAAMEHIVERPEIMAKLLYAVKTRSNAAVGLTTALEGAGGFGKTTLAAEACRRLQREAAFPEGVIWITIGEKVFGAELAEKINSLCEVISGRRPEFPDPEQAGYHLASLIGSRRMLLVIDDVWHRVQLRPFLVGGENCVRLITTRVKSSLPAGATTILVDAMSHREARTLLNHEAGSIERNKLENLISATGRWPVLLTLVNKTLRRLRGAGASADQAADHVQSLITRVGPATLDLKRPLEREEAVSATVEASLAVLAPEMLDRYLSLGIFDEDLDIPTKALELLWAEPGEEPATTVVLTCSELSDLSLTTPGRSEGSIRLHDVLRSYIRARSGKDYLRRVNQRLLATLSGTFRATGDQADPPPWWDLPSDLQYFWRYLAYHLREAGNNKNLAQVVCDLRFITAKLSILGPVAVEADLVQVDTPTARKLRRCLSQSSQLLEETTPAYSVIDIFLSRLQGTPELADVASTAATLRSSPRLVTVRELPDTPHPALLRAVGTESRGLWTCLTAADDTWFAGAGGGGSIGIWNSATGDQEAVLEGHRGLVRTCAASPDGRLLASGGEDRLLRLWDVRQNAPHRILQGHQNGISSCVFGPDGSWVASASSDGEIRVWDVDSGTFERLDRQRRSGVWSIARTDDGKTMAVAGDDRVVELYDLRTRRFEQLLAGFSSDIYSVAVSAGGEFIACAGGSGAISCWEKPHFTRFQLPNNDVSGIWSLALSPDRSYLAAGCNDGTLRLWDTRTRNLRAVAEGHRGWIRSCSFSRSGRWLVTAGDDGRVRVWDAARLETAGARSIPYRSMIRDCVVSLRGGWVATAGEDSTARVWNPTTGLLHNRLKGHVGPVRTCAPDPAGAWLATGGDDGRVLLWDLSSATGMPWSLGEHQGWIRTCAASPDGTLLATAGDDRVVRVWDIPDRRLRCELSGHDSAVNSCGFSPDGQWLASASDDRTVRLWDVASGASLKVLKGHTAIVRSCAFGPDSILLASSSVDGTLRLWNASTGDLLHSIEAHSAAVWGCAVSPRNDCIASAGGDGSVRLWDVGTGRLRFSLGNDLGALRSCIFDPAGEWVAGVGAEGLIYFWDPRDGTLLRTIEAHTSMLADLAVAAGSRLSSVSTSGQVTVHDAQSSGAPRVLSESAPGLVACGADDRSPFVAVGGSRGTLRLWNTLTGSTIYETERDGCAITTCALSLPARLVITGDGSGRVNLRDLDSGALVRSIAGAGWVRTCAVSTDGKLLASGGDDRQVRVWNLASNELLMTLDGHIGWIHSCSFSSDGMRLVSASEDMTARVWDTSTGATLHILECHKAPVRGCAVSRDSRLVATVSDDNSMRVWSIRTGECIAMMRVASRLASCVWLPEQRLAAGGAAGLYLFDFVGGS
jgi:WD40 repeat protein